MARRNSLKRRSRIAIAPHDRTPLEVEQRLGEILSSLASVLLANGYGIARLNRLARRAYVDAARVLNAQAGRKFSNARIAAQTGLTRTEVARLTQEGNRAQHDEETPVNRAQRVTAGWLSDFEFCTGIGKPKTLPFAGKKRSFSNLVKHYSGDIPARAMLMEMQRLGIVSVEPGDKIKLVRSDTRISKHTILALRAMSQWTRVIAASDGGKQLNVNTRQVKLSFASLQQLLAAVRELENRSRAFVRSIEELGTRRRSAGLHQLEISIALAARTPKSRRQLRDI
jgi:hypothetical protein